MKHKAYNPLRKDLCVKRTQKVFLHEQKTFTLSESDKAQLTIQESRSKFVALCTEHSYIPPMPKSDWRVVDNGPYGQPHGLPTFSGRLVATNGLLCLIQTPTGLVWSRSDSFEPDKAKKAERKLRKPSRFDLLLTQLTA